MAKKATLPEFEMLGKYKIKPLPYGIAKTEEDALEIAKKIGYPVALKIVSPEITHKTDVGGVKVRIKDEKRLKHAYEDIMEGAKKHKITGVLVQKMARRGVELIIGGKKDPQFGHLVILGMGGVYVEIFRDVTARICPINKQDVKDMINELESHPLITGIRGMKPIKLGALYSLMVKTSKMIVNEDMEELDLNPVIFDEKGYDIVDVRYAK
ncbi:acetyl-CoA synthetase [Candidatus Micrarchaeota archaeon]|nr:acetyl-CoA synthetase [Candidatus Micrarchaeota archaeon]MBD3417716.1 acetyl-CoA synthetase [Candidatus Micrarchaeota archaeon]